MLLHRTYVKSKVTVTTFHSENEHLSSPPTTLILWQEEQCTMIVLTLLYKILTFRSHLLESSACSRPIYMKTRRLSFLC